MKKISILFVLLLSIIFIFNLAGVEANDQSVKKEMIATAAKSKDVLAVPELINILTDDQDGYTRAFTAWALGEIGDNSAVSALNNALSDIDKGVRAEAGKALSKLNQG